MREEKEKRLKWLKRWRMYVDDAGKGGNNLGFTVKG